jgi:aminomethyltransferase
VAADGDGHLRCADDCFSLLPRHSPLVKKMLRTACYSWHVAHGGRMVDFAGWEMPVQYTSIIEEHQAVRQAAGLFDIAHMGRIKFTGPDACRFLDHLLTNDVTKLKPGEIRYSLVTNEAGGILDDVLVYRFESFYFLVVNASNRLKIVDWIAAHHAGFDVTVDDVTTQTFMLAVQGPRALETLLPHVNADIGGLAYYAGSEAVICGRPGIVSRTGYTGEDGFECVVETSDGLDVWHALIAGSREIGLQACGLGARDTLRLEAAMPLYGHELDETIDPLTAGLSFAVKLKAGDFIGKAALVAIKGAASTGTGIRKERVGLVLSGKRIAREGAPVFIAGRAAGRVTSGTFSPTLEKPIAMAYVDADAAKVGEPAEIDIRGKCEPATLVDLPFYKRG